MPRRDQAFIGLRCEPQLLELIKKQAAEEDRTISSLLRVAVKEYINGRQAYIPQQKAG